MTAFRVHGTRLNIERLGDAGPPAVVCLHGLAADSLATYYFTVAPGIAAAGHSVVMYDQRGHGRSERPPAGYRLEDFTADLLAVLDDLGIHRPVLVGNCFGGSVALDFAAHHPDRVAGLVLVESVLPTPGWAQGLHEWLIRFADLLRDAGSIRCIEEEHGRHTARKASRTRPLLLDTTLVDDIAASRTREQDHWRTVEVPVLALFGGDFTLAAAAPVMEQVLPRCRSIVVPGHGHDVLAEAPGTVGGLMLDWLREVRPAAPAS
ncbi:alpha/beta fold hydrolase [Streptomyces sp. NPDC002536]